MKKKKLFIGLGLIIALVCVIGVLIGIKSSDGALADGVYSVEITMEGGSGKASIASPATLTVSDGKMYATIVWSSENYDYMIVDGETYFNENEGGNSTFTIPVAALDEELTVIGDTTAMSVPHEVEYTLIFHVVETDFEDLSWEDTSDLSYATQFQIQKSGAYTLITIVSDGRYLLVPEEATTPVNIPEDVVVINTPITSSYMVSSAVMDLACTIGATDQISLSGTKEEDWYIEEAKEAMQAGTMVYAGKYNEPDYELILSMDCDLAIENTMIYHTPEVKEKLEELGIPVFVDRSSYENHPLGRLEWIKVYGEIYGKQEEAEAFYEEELKEIEPVLEKEETGKTVAFFYMKTTGSVNVRKPNDYVAQMIELAGGEYVFSDVIVEDDNATSTMKMEMEDFYAAAVDADIIIYNCTLGGELESIDDLIEINSLFSQFKAVQEGNVYCTSNNFYQESTGVCDFIEDLYAIYTDDGSAELTFLEKLE